MQPNDSQPRTIGSKAPADFHPEERILAEAVRTLCGGISDMTLWRWLNTPALGFPRPVLINRIRYWKRAEVTAWLASREVAA